MQRVALHTRLKAGREEEYERIHREIPPDLDALLRASGVHAWSIYRHGRDLFHVVDCDDYAAFLRATNDHPVNRAWQARMADLLEVVHDYGDAEGNTLPLVWSLP
ncbi:MAG: L-rhamnose mutarotase [Candidatus Eremiobacteraeota bacterium]|nr:L-rhamnose mutarotase [Candidatus Eremiobacteraeota bacterium]MBV9407714.1 L-rhamnose mutarotase [Candidatus Eremiobacteraeota bacterium]